MLFYDWKLISKEAGRSSKRVLTIVKTMLEKQKGKQLPSNRWDYSYPYFYKDFSGNSFLINPEPLFINRGYWMDKELANYIGLASFRNFNDYRLFGKTTLDLIASPLSLTQIKQNRLFQLKNDKIHFKYEE